MAATTMSLAVQPSKTLVAGRSLRTASVVRPQVSRSPRGSARRP